MDVCGWWLLGLCPSHVSRDLEQACKGLGFNYEDNEVNELIQRMDFKQTGTIDFEEFVNFLLLVPSESIRDAFFEVRTCGVHMERDRGSCASWSSCVRVDVVCG